MSEPLTEPGPLYQPELDRVLAWHDATYSQHDWSLPRMLLPHPDSSTRAAVFAAALLGGKVVPGMASLAGALVAPAASAARPELVGLARVGELLQALQSKQVSLLMHEAAQTVYRNAGLQWGVTAEGQQLALTFVAAPSMQLSWFSVFNLAPEGFLVGMVLAQAACAEGVLLSNLMLCA